jgi:hypothetical protein
MLTQATELRQGANRLHRQFFQLGRSGDVPHWEPPVDMYGDEQLLCLLPHADYGVAEMLLQKGCLRLICMGNILSLL